MFTVASATVKDLPLELHFPPGVVGRGHGARNILLQRPHSKGG